MAVPAMPHAAVIVVAPAFPPWGVHGIATGRAELPPLRQHAPFDPPFVGNKVVAEAQRIGHAKFAGVALSDGPVQAGKQRDNWQGQEQDETQIPHMFTPERREPVPALVTQAVRRAAVDDPYPRGSQMQSELENAAALGVSVPKRNSTPGSLVGG